MPESRRPETMTKAELLRELQRVRRRLRRIEGELEAERSERQRRMAAVRRGADRRLTAMMREIATLRHHEARAAQLERLLAERPADGSPDGGST
jgi:hypothetical protein